MAMNKELYNLFKELNPYILYLVIQTITLMTTKLTKNAHCSYCGTKFEEGLAFPRNCKHCGNTTYVNPIPVSVALVPIDGGLLAVRRNIEPRKGLLALPGGFIDLGESWQQAAAREVQEETGLLIKHEEIVLFDTLSAPDGTVLVFGLLQTQQKIALPAFEANAETQELQIITQAQELAFPLHTQVIKRYFDNRVDE